MSKPRANAYLTVVVLMTACIVIEFVYIYTHPQSMIEALGIATLEYLTATAAVGGLVVYLLVSYFMKLPLRYAIHTVIGCSMVTFVGVNLVQELPVSRNYITKLYHQESSLYNEPVNVQLGEMEPDILERLRNELPDQFSLYMVDATDAKYPRYWLILVDHSGGRPTYRVCTYNPKTDEISHAFSVQDMWAEVCSTQGIASNVNYLQVDGFPIDGNKNQVSDAETFSRTRTVNFKSSTGKMYSVTLVPNADNVQLDVSSPG